MCSDQLVYNGVTWASQLKKIVKKKLEKNPEISKAKFLAKIFRFFFIHLEIEVFQIFYINLKKYDCI